MLTAQVLVIWLCATTRLYLCFGPVLELKLEMLAQTLCKIG